MKATKTVRVRKETLRMLKKLKIKPTEKLYCVIERLCDKYMFGTD